MTLTPYRADILSSLLEGLETNPVNHSKTSSNQYSFFCPHEQEIRRIYLRYATGCDSGFKDSYGSALYNRFYNAVCLNCHHVVFISVFHVDDGPRLILVDRDQNGSLSSSVPDSIKHYLNQASRAHGAGANSAAVAMYRAALEQFLYSAGFQSGMLQNKITAFEKAASDPSMPKWMRDLDKDYLDIIKELGNSSIHPNGGDISAQDKFDEVLVSNIQIVFSDLIYKRFEEPLKAEERKALLRQGITKKPAS